MRAMAQMAAVSALSVLAVDVASAEAVAADRAAARALMVEDLVSGTVTPDMAGRIATCRLDRMTDSQVARYLSAPDEPDAETAFQDVADIVDQVACEADAVRRP